MRPIYSSLVVAAAVILSAGPVPYTAPEGDLNLDGAVDAVDVQCQVLLFDAVEAAGQPLGDLCVADDECGGAAYCRPGFYQFLQCLPVCLHPDVYLGMQPDSPCDNPMADDEDCLGVVEKKSADMNCDGEMTNADFVFLVALVTGKAAGEDSADADQDGLLNFCDTDSDGDSVEDEDDCAVLDAQVGSCDDGNACTEDYCQAGACVNQPLSDVLCDDGDECTHGDSCLEGVCTATPYSCTDDNPCTDDGCNGDGTCRFEINTAPCDDGDDCTHTDTCGLAVCVGVPYECDDGDLCTADLCLGDGSCTTEFNTAPCDDGDACTVDDACSLGVCVGGKGLTCDDGNLCTDDVCLAGPGCVFTETTMDCSDGNECTEDACDPDSGSCVYAFVEPGTPCDDGKDCTATDQCLQGVCSGVGPSVCPRELYVDAGNVSGDEDGSITYPYSSIGRALTDAIAGDTVWVLPGNYKEIIKMVSGVKLRSLAGADKTIIKYVRHAGGVQLITCSGCSEETLIEGFTLEAGIQHSGQSYAFSIYSGSSPTIRNNMILAYHWQAYAIVVSGSESRPTIINNTVKSWDGSAETAGIVVSSGYPTVKNNIFIGDYAGGGKASWGVDVNNGYSLEENSHNYFYHQSTPVSGAAMGEGSVFDNQAAPEFVDPDNYDYHLAPGSPGIDMGDPDPAYNDPDGSRNDMGAFGGPFARTEYVPPVAPEPVPALLPNVTVYVDGANDTGVEDGSQDSPFNTIGEGIIAARAGDTVFTAEGNYNEIVRLEAGISLVGEDPHTTSIDGKDLDEEWGGNASMVVWAADGATLKGFRIMNSGYYGVYCKTVAGVTMSNMIIANVPHTGFRYDTCEATLVNNTFVNNGYASLTSGHQGNTVVLMNNIFANGGSIYELSTDETYNLFHASGYFSGGGEGDVAGDPLFAEPGLGDYHLLEGSPAIDAGNPDGSHNDADGTRNDMGAFGGPALGP